MTTRKVIRGTAVVLLAWGLAWTIASCASTPPKPAPVPVAPTPEPTPAPVPPPAPEPVPPTPAPTPEPVAPPAPEPVSAQDFQAAEQAIAEAEAVEADKYSPDLLNQARQALANAHAKADADPDAARDLLKTSIAKGE